jgi:hypothetical protein
MGGDTVIYESNLRRPVWIARTLGLEPPSFEQPQYHVYDTAVRTAGLATAHLCRC